jgi:hypothetical protein
MGRVLVPYLHDVLWPEALSFSGVSKPKPALQIVMRNSDEGPFVEGDRLVFPALFLIQSFSFGLLVSHDVWVSKGHTFPVIDPVLQHPHATQLLIPLLDLKALDFDSGALMGIVATTNCQGKEPECEHLQGTSVTGILGFALGHEYAHIIRGEASPGQRYSLEEEKAADAWAMSFLSRIRQQSPLPRNDRTVMEAGAPAFLHFRSILTGAKETDLDQRAEAIATKLIRESRDMYELLVDTPPTAGLAWLRIPALPQARVVLINGTRFDPAELNRRLTINSGEFIILTVFDDGVACNRLVIGEGETATPKVIKIPFATGPAEPSERETLADAGRWSEVLARTSDPKLRPRARELAYDHFNALSHCGAQSLIDPALLPDAATDSQKRQVRRWFLEGQVLSPWTK